MTQTRPQNSDSEKAQRWGLVLALAWGLLLAWLQLSGSFQVLEYPILDRFMGWRHRLGKGPRVDPRVTVVGIDQSAHQELEKPEAFWLEDYRRVVEHLLDSGAVAVGFDLVLSPRFDKLEPKSARELLQRQVRGLGVTVLQRPVVLVEAYRRDGPPTRSLDMLHLAARENGNVVFNNLLTDPDGVVRRLGLFFYDDEPSTIRVFAGRLAELASGASITMASDGRVKGLLAQDGYSMTINYPGPAGSSFRHLSFTELLAEPPLDLKGAVCLLGAYDDESNDLHTTPFGMMMGVEIHAAALNTILTQQFLPKAPAWAVMVLHLLSAGLAFVLARWASAPWFLAGSALVFSYPLVCLGLFIAVPVLLPVASPVLAYLTVAGVTYYRRHRESEEAVRTARSLLGRYVSPQVMQTLLAHPEYLGLEGRRRRITILFSDINNFTPTCETRSPEEILEMLNRYFKEMLAIIDRHGGTLKQFIGDELMVLYGAPEPLEDHAARAVLTARDMVVRLAELRAQPDAPPGFYEIKIGIHTGDVVVGNIGSMERSEYTAVGDDVNLTARLEGLTKELKEEILVSEVTRNEAAPHLSQVEFVSRGVQGFKGKRARMEVFGLRWQD